MVVLLIFLWDRINENRENAMISQNDLYDITSALVAIRNDIQYKFNSEILSKIIQVLRYDEKKIRG